MEVRRHGWLAAVVAALTLGGFAPAAGAATAQVTDNGTEQVLEFTAAPGEANHLTVSRPGLGETGYALVDSGPGVTITPGAGCTADPLVIAKVSCEPAGLDRIAISLGDQADTLYLYSSDIPVAADGGADNDLFEDVEIATGTPARSFTGGEGDDYFTAKSDPTFPQRLAHDYAGGPGVDIVSYADRTASQDVSIDNVANDGEPGEGDNVRSDVEQVLGGPAADKIVGSAGNEYFVGNGGADTLQGEGGDDKLKASAGCDADKLIGGDGADTLFLGGNTTAEGGLGGDQIISDDGACPAANSDVVNGGDGVDLADFGFVNAPLSVSLDDLANDGWGGADNFHSDIENVAAGNGGMVLIGSDGPNELVGGEGNDVLDGRGGADQLRGGDGVDGDGIDTADYSSRTVPVSLTLDDSDNDGATGEGDGIWSNVENLRGGSANDTLAGNALNNVLDGGLGADTISGGAGIDAVDYFNRTAPVSVTLASGVGNDGQAGEGDTIASDVEGAFGGLGNDTLSGNAANGFLSGSEGNDKLSDSGGVDTLDAGAGNDEIDSVDGAADHDICGTGTDKVTSDAADSVDADCEPAVVPPTDPPVNPPAPPTQQPPGSPQPPATQPQTPVTPIDHVAPVVSLSMSKGQRLANLRSSGLKLTIRSNEIGTLAGALTAESTTRSSLRRLGRSVKTVLAKGQADALAGASKTLRLRLTRQGRRALRGFAAGKFKLVLTVTDRAGNKLTLTRHLRL